MQINIVFDEKTRRIILIVTALVILLPLGYSVVCAAFSLGATDSQPFLERPGPKHPACVKDTRYMRYHHMDYLKQLREDAVREGKRGDVGLNSCSECHTSRERFCDQCHSTVNLKLDCFGCHYYP